MRNYFPLLSNDLHGTTILCVRKDNQVVRITRHPDLQINIALQVVIGDGQVTQGHTVVKPNARKVRRIRPGIVAGFAGTKRNEQFPFA